MAEYCALLGTNLKPKIINTKVYGKITIICEKLKAKIPFGICKKKNKFEKIIDTKNGGNIEIRKSKNITKYLLLEALHVKRYALGTANTNESKTAQKASKKVLHVRLNNFVVSTQLNPTKNINKNGIKFIDINTIKRSFIFFKRHTF